jgi:hypothetical protein
MHPLAADAEWGGVGWAQRRGTNKAAGRVAKSAAVSSPPPAVSVVAPQAASPGTAR